MLILERQRWDGRALRHGNPEEPKPQGPTAQHHSIKRGHAEWFSSLQQCALGFSISDDELLFSREGFDNGIIELDQLDDNELLGIVRYFSMPGGQLVELGDDQVLKSLKQIDGSGRPLYAAFVGTALAQDSFDPDWTRADLLTEVLQRDQLNRWKQLFSSKVPSIGDASDDRVKLALFATITGGIDPRTSDLSGLDLDLKADIVEGALILVDGPIAGGIHWPGWEIPAMQPSLLGEWFFVFAAKSGFPVHELMRHAWRIAPVETADFVRRVSADFTLHDEILDLLQDGVPEGLESAQAALAEVVCEIIYNLNHAGLVTASREGVCLPNGCQAALDYALSKDNPHAFVLCGDMSMITAENPFMHSAEVAFRNYVHAGKRGVVSALLNEGVLRTVGHGDQTDNRTALDCFKDAEELGSISAVTEVGICSLWGRDRSKRHRFGDKEIFVSRKAR